MVTSIHHVGIAVKSLSQAYGFWRDTLGLPLVREATVEGTGRARGAAGRGRQRDRAAGAARRREPASAKFLAKRGEGLHHLCFRTADVAGI